VLSSRWASASARSLISPRCRIMAAGRPRNAAC